MTEPVAYWHIPQIENEEIFVDFSPSKSLNFENIPLYTAEQLQPRVKMTQAEFDELDSIPEFASVYGAMVALYFSNIIKHVKLINRFSGNDGQIEFANLWFDFRIKHKSREETIEIVPDMKWFVRSKEKYEADIVQGLPESGYLYLTDGGSYSIEYCEMTTFKDDATQFGTKEEAELWTNPLTEAVQLPVDEK